MMPAASTARRSGAALAWLLTDPALAGVTGDWAADLDGYCSAVIASLT